MANVELAARLHCSYKRATFVLCAGNLVVALYLLQSVVGPFYFQTSNSSSSSSSSELQQQGLIPTLSPFSFSHLLSFHPFSFPFLFLFVFFFFWGHSFLSVVHISSSSSSSCLITEYFGFVFWLNNFWSTFSWSVFSNIFCPFEGSLAMPGLADYLGFRFDQERLFHRFLGNVSMCSIAS